MCPYTVCLPTRHFIRPNKPPIKKARICGPFLFHTFVLIISLLAVLATLFGPPCPAHIRWRQHRGQLLLSSITANRAFFFSWVYLLQRPTLHRPDFPWLSFLCFLLFGRHPSKTGLIFIVQIQHPMQAFILYKKILINWQLTLNHAVRKCVVFIQRGSYTGKYSLLMK